MPKLKIMITTLTGSAVPMMRAMLLLLFFVYIASVFGLTFFIGDLDFWDGYMVSSFSSVQASPSNIDVVGVEH
jgi:hypothetical protein